METLHIDVAIIGAGSAGLSARREVELRGKSYVLIERGPLGTTCARVGCMPSKLLIAAAEAHHAAHDAVTFGIDVPEGVAVNGRAVMKRVREERDRFVGFVVRGVEKLPPERRLEGEARFVGPNTLEVAGRQVVAQSVIIATGSSPWIPPQLEAIRERVELNDDLFSWDDLPGSVAMIGTGVIALELGQALHRLGVRVTFFNPFDALGPMTDPAVIAKMKAVWGEELDLQTGTGLANTPALEANDDGTVTFSWVTPEGDTRRETFEKVIAAAGRRPNVEGLALERAGVELDARGVPLFDPTTMQVGDAPIFLAGDVNNERALLHEASDEGRIAGANAALYPNTLAHQRRATLAIAFTDPQLAIVGARHADLEPGSFVIGEVSYDDQGRARVMNKHSGLVRIYARRCDGVLLGAEMFGPRVEHTAHLLAWAVQQGQTVRALLRMPFYHPVVEEGIRTALRDAARALKIEHAPCATGLDCGPGV